jgi:OmcA/MtrC family decaheme c-type cytochrome
MKRTLIAIAALALSGAPKSPYSANDKAHYASEATVNFVRPGLVIRILGVEIAQDGVIRARYRLSDPRGLPLDRLGVTTPGNVNISFVIATIPAGQAQYTAYTVRTQNSTITGRSAIQAAADTNGVHTQTAEGEYTYTFGTRAPTGIDRAATHSVGAYGNRNLTEFDLGINYDDDVFTFVPNGARVTVTRDVIRNETCNRCHDQLAFHGGSRRSIELCVMCHSPQTTDPDTGNTVDMPTMIHRIHSGRNLPSVRAGTPYRIIGNQNTIHDYSTIAFPAIGAAANCTACHEKGKGAAQEDAWLQPSRAACGSCHDDVNFATGQGHVNLPQPNDARCGTCHIPQGELDRDASIVGSHVPLRLSTALPGTVFEIHEVSAAAGRAPTVTFSIKDKSGKPIAPASMDRLALVLAGPAVDYSAMVSEDPRRADGAADGRYFWTFQAPIPANARGTWSVGIEGYRNVTLLQGTTKQAVVRDAGDNKVMHFAVDGSRVAPRRRVVATDRCNACHSFLSLHGENRNQVEMCVLCHNPTATDAARRPANLMPAEAIDFRTMIHKIHSGKELPYRYSIYGFGGTENNYNEVGFPGDRANCSNCHLPGTEQLPLREGLLPVNDPRGRLNPAGPTTAACTSCHASVAAAAHALTATTPIGEACAVCHGPNADFSVGRVHAR